MRRTIHANLGSFNTSWDSSGIFQSWAVRSSPPALTQRSRDSASRFWIVASWPNLLILHYKVNYLCTDTRTINWIKVLYELATSTEHMYSATEWFLFSSIKSCWRYAQCIHEHVLVTFPDANRAVRPATIELMRVDPEDKPLKRSKDQHIVAITLTCVITSTI